MKYLIILSIALSACTRPPSVQESAYVSGVKKFVDGEVVCYTYRAGISCTRDIR